MKILLTVLSIFIFSGLMAQNSHPKSDTSLIKKPKSKFKAAGEQDFIKAFQDAMWDYVGNTGNNEKWYLYSSYAEKNDEGIKIWIKVEMPTSSYKNKTYKNTIHKELIVFDCLNKKFKTISDILYNNRGDVIYNNTIQDDYQYAAPDSIISALMETACQKYN